MQSAILLHCVGNYCCDFLLSILLQFFISWIICLIYFLNYQIEVHPHVINIPYQHLDAYNLFLYWNFPWMCYFFCQCLNWHESMYLNMMCIYDYFLHDTYNVNLRVYLITLYKLDSRIFFYKRTYHCLLTILGLMRI